MNLWHVDFPAIGVKSVWLSNVTFLLSWNEQVTTEMQQSISCATDVDSNHTKTPCSNDISWVLIY